VPAGRAAKAASSLREDLFSEIPEAIFSSLANRRAREPSDLFARGPIEQERRGGSGSGSPRAVQIRVEESLKGEVEESQPAAQGSAASAHLRVIDSDSDDERRSTPDRRDAPTRVWDSLFGFRRRRHGRRDGESQNVYVDTYSRVDVAMLLGVFILNILDAFFTLRWLQMGGGEGNPLMDMLIQSSDLLFLLQKCVVVGFWLVILVIHKNFRIARVGLWASLVLYTLILLYHFVLQSMGPPPQFMPDPPGAG
jgi:hypothetical protein